MIKVIHAALHMLNLDTGALQLSTHELDLSDRATRSYVQRLARKMSDNPESGHATLNQDQSFASELGRYSVGSRSFIDFSQDIARTLWEPLRASEDAVPFDVLALDFTNTEKQAALPPQEEGDGALAEGGETSHAVPQVKGEDVDSEDRTRRFVGVALLPRRRMFIHELGEIDGDVSSGLAISDAALPNPTQKLSHYALVDVETNEAEVVDVGVTIAGRTAQVLTDTLLACKPAPSPRNVVDRVVQLVGELAEDAGRSASLAMADAKDCMTHSAQQQRSVAPFEVGERVFANEPELAGRFEEVARAEGLPEEVPMRPSAATRLVRTHRIRTDTGIDIAFPSAYAADQHFIEFSRDEQGGIQIVIHAASIENR